MIFNATAGKDSLNNISVYDRITDVNMLGGRYFRVSGTNKIFDVRSILTGNENSKSGDGNTGAEKFNKGQEILEQDVLSNIWIDDKDDLLGYKKNLLDLINGKTLSTSEKIRIVYEGKVVELEGALYSKQAYNGEAGAEEQQYYRTEDGTFLKKEKITPPAFKQITEEQARLIIDRNGLSIYDGAFRRFDAIKYLDDKNKAHFIRNGQIKYEFNADTNAFDAVIRYDVISSSGFTEVKTVVVNSVSKEVETNLDTESGFSTTVTNVVNYGDGKYKKYSENGREVEFSFKLDKSPREITIKQHKGRPDTDIHFVEGVSDDENTLPVKKITKSYRKASHSKYGKLQIGIEIENEAQLVKKDDKVVGIKNLQTSQIFKLSDFPFEISLKETSKKEQQFDYSKVAVYKESRLFKSENEKNVIEADLIQTSAVGQDSEFAAYDYGDRQRIFAEFEHNLDQLKYLSEQGINSESDFKKIQNLKKIIDDQLNKLGDYETAKVINEKKKKLEEEKSKTGAERDQSKIEEAQKEYDEAIKNIGYYKDKNNLATIDDVIRKYQQGEFFNTFYFDKNGKKVEINSGEITTVTSNLPFEWSKSKTVNSVLGKDSIAFNKDTGKAEVAMSSGAKDVAVAGAKLAGVLLSYSFSVGPISLLLMPLTVPLAATCISVSAVTAVGELVRTKIKQAYINNLTPQKLKDKQDLELGKSIEKELKKALKTYNEDLTHAERNFKSKKDLAKLRIEAENKLRETRKAIFRQYMLAAGGNISSNFNKKDKKITNENLYGFLEYKRKLKEVKHGKKLDLDTELKIEAAKMQYKKDIKHAEVVYKDDPKTLTARKKQLSAHYNDAKNEFLSENGPVKLRLFYLRKTEKYFKASRVERKNMEAECKEKCGKDLTGIAVENVALKNDKLYLESFKLRALNLAKTFAPSKGVDGKPFDDEASLLYDDLKVPVSISAEEEGLDITHDEGGQFEQVQDAVKEYSKISEKCDDALNSQDTNTLTKAVDEIYDASQTNEEELRNLVGDDTAKKILEDKAIWFDEKSSKSEIRQLKDFIELLKNTYNTPESRNKYLLDKYDVILESRVEEMIDKLKKEFEDDKEVISELKPINIKRCKKYIFKTYENKNPRYGLMGENEKFIKFLEQVLKKESLKDKKEELLKPFKAVEKIIKDKQEQRMEKEEAEKNAFIEKAQKEVEKWYKIADDEQIKKYDSLATQIYNAKFDKVSIEEFKKLYKQFKDLTKIEKNHTI